MNDLWNIEQANDFLDSGIGTSLPATPEKKLQLQEAINQIAAGKADPIYAGFAQFGHKSLLPLLLGGIASTAIVGTANAVYNTFFITENVTDQEDAMHQAAGGFGDLLDTKFNRMMQRLAPFYGKGRIKKWKIKEEAGEQHRDHLHAIVRTNLTWKQMIALLRGGQDSNSHPNIRQAYYGFLDNEWEYYIDAEGHVVFRKKRIARGRSHTEGFPPNIVEYLDGDPGGDANSSSDDGSEPSDDESDDGYLQDLIDAGDEQAAAIERQTAAALKAARIQLRALRKGVNSVKALLLISAIVGGLLKYLGWFHLTYPRYVPNSIKRIKEMDKTKYPEVHDALSSWEKQLKQDQMEDFFESEEEIDIITVDEHPHAWELPAPPFSSGQDQDTRSHKSCTSEYCYCANDDICTHDGFNLKEGQESAAYNLAERRFRQLSESDDSSDSDYIP